VLGEPPNTTAALLDAVAACLAAAGTPDAPVVPATGAAQDGWLALRAGRAALACTVVQISGVSCPVAIAILTGDATQAEQPAEQHGEEHGEEQDDEREEVRGEERRAESGRRQRRAGGTKTSARKAGTKRQNAATAARRGRSGGTPGLSR